MEDGRATRCGGVRDWVRSPSGLIYINFALSAWGDRLWHFSVGLYLVHLDGGSLRLAAIFGFTVGVCILLLGGLIGNWVDSNPRLKVVRVSLFMQNSLVLLSAITVHFVLDHHSDSQVKGQWESRWRPLCEAVIVILSLIAELASVAYKVSISKDWIVVVAAGNKKQLANLNAITRAIDLMCKVLAPTVAGLVMTYGSLKIAALFIAGWNLVSVCIEYLLLRRVYHLVPRLAVKQTTEDDSKEKEMKEIKTINPEPSEKFLESENRISSDVSDNKAEKENLNENICPTSKSEKHQEKSEKVEEEESKAMLNKSEDDCGENEKKRKSVVRLMFDPFLNIFYGWRTYARQQVVFAGLALALLYMTVLGFDSITIGYIYYQGVPEYIVGICTAIAGVTGLLGTFLFTRVRSKFGLERTGLFSFNAEITCIVLCVVSVWAPGSPFSIHGPRSLPPTYNCSSILANNQTFPDQPVIDYDINPTPNSTIKHLRYTRDATVEEKQMWPLHNEYFGDVSSFVLPSRSKRNIFMNDSGVETVQEMYSPWCDDQPPRPKISIILFLTGILSSRVGLWMSDLVVTQLLQENVVEQHRGVVGGVQHSLNMLLDTIKFTLVIFVPHIHTFGILILLSFFMICMGGASFAFHAYRTFKREENKKDQAVNGTLPDVRV